MKKDLLYICIYIGIYIIYINHIYIYIYIYIYQILDALCDRKIEK